jgi:RNase P/RNase MRP subunit p29
MTTERYSDNRDIRALISGEVIDISGQAVAVFTGNIDISGETVVVASGPFIKAMISGQMVTIASGTGPILIETSGELVKVSGEWVIALTSGQVAKISGETIIAKVSGQVAKVSGEVLVAKTSGEVAKISGETIIAKVSGEVAKISGEVMKVSGEILIGKTSGEVVKISGETLSVNSGTGPIMTAAKQPTVVNTYITRPVANLSGGICVVSGGASIPVRAAIVKCLSGYSDMYVGGSGTPVSASNRPLSSFGMMLCEGEAVSLDIDNLNAIYASAPLSGHPLSVIGISY